MRPVGDLFQVGIAHHPGGDSEKRAQHHTQNFEHENEDASVWSHSILRRNKRGSVPSREKAEPR
jgi:hypothetical protein